MKVEGFALQEQPGIYVVSLAGKWLLNRVTPSWRLKDPQKGFQRIVSEPRAREIAKTVLERRRTFPNAIVLATDSEAVERQQDGTLNISEESLFLIIDGQHRLWAQNFSNYEAQYACLIHTGLNEQQMAGLFIEINDNQKRVPSSLRWDLVRLVREEKDPEAVRAADLLFDLNGDKDSPLMSRVDLTGEVKELILKQGSLAPEIRSIIKKHPLNDSGYDIQKEVILSFFVALRDFDPDGWNNATSPFFSNRVLRALLRLLPRIIIDSEKQPEDVNALMFLKYLDKIDPQSLNPEVLRGQQGSAGISAIHNSIASQIF